MAEFTKILSQDFIAGCLRNSLQNQKCSQLHAGSCNRKGFSQFIQGVKGVYKMYLLVHLIPLLVLKRKKLKENPMRQIKKTLVGFIKSLLFAGGYSMLVRRIICFLTQVYSFNNVIAYFSGLGAGVTLIFEPISRQSQIALYTLNKSTQVLYNMAIRRNWKVKISYGQCWLLAVALSIISFTYMQDPLIWRQNYRKILDKVIGSI